jgi:hypothetical protein
MHMFARKLAILGGLGGLCAALIAFVPALSATDNRVPAKRAVQGLRNGIGTFTPAAADPRLAAALARSGLSNSGFRFTPSVSIGNGRAITVAVRTRSIHRPMINDRLVEPSATVGITPVAYDLGVGLGWKRFALHGDIARIDTGVTLGSREIADVGISYNSKKWSTRVQVATERPIGNVPRTITGDESVALDVGGSYRLTRNIDVTAGVRYKSERYRLERPQDDRRDSQAIYVGTAFRF